MEISNHKGTRFTGDWASRRYSPRTPRLRSPLPTVHLQPGEYLVSAEKKVVSTVLGSCVSVCLFDRHLLMGAICHVLLPYPSGSRSLREPGAEGEGRFAATVIPRLLETLYSIGSGPDLLEASVVGGAGLMNLASDHPMAIGARNIETTLSVLREAGVAVKNQDTGGHRARRLHFRPWNGKVRVEWV